MHHRAWVLATVLTWVPAAALAQSGEGRPTLQQFGFEAGIGQASLAGSDGASPVLGLLAGGFYTPNPNAVTWQAGGLLHWKGARIGTATLRLWNLELPLLVRLNFRQARTTGWHLLAGPVLAYRARVTLRTDEGVADLTSSTSAFEYGALIGGGVTSGVMGVGVRFMQSLNTTGFVVDARATRTRSVMAVFTYRVE